MEGQEQGQGVTAGPGCSPCCNAYHLTTYGQLWPIVGSLPTGCLKHRLDMAPCTGSTEARCLWQARCFQPTHSWCNHTLALPASSESSPHPIFLHCSMQIRAAAFTSLIALLDVVAPDVRKARVLPVLRAHMQPYDLDPIMQRCVARNFGQMMAVVSVMACVCNSECDGFAFWEPALMGRVCRSGGLRLESKHFPKTLCCNRNAHRHHGIEAEGQETASDHMHV